MSRLSRRKAQIVPGPLLTLVVPDSEVGVVSSFGSQTVVEMLTIVRVILIHSTHCLDELKQRCEFRVSWMQWKRQRLVKA